MKSPRRSVSFDWMSPSRPASGLFNQIEAVASCAIAALLASGAAGAETADSADASAGGDVALPAIVVTAQHLDEERSHIQTQTGASTYTIDAQAIAATPGRANTLLNQVVLQAPDVAQDSFGQYHVRGEHAGSAISHQRRDPAGGHRGVRPDSRSAPYFLDQPGHRSVAGRIRTATPPASSTSRRRAALQAPGGFVSLYGGSHGEVQPSLAYGGGAGSFSYFVTGDFLRNDLGIESPDGSSNPIHDHTTQYHGFGYFEDILDDENRVALMLGTFRGQVPDTESIRRSSRRSGSRSTA